MYNNILGAVKLNNMAEKLMEMQISTLVGDNPPNIVTFGPVL